MPTYIGEEQVKGGTLKYGERDPVTGTREELFVKAAPAPTPSVTPTDTSSTSGVTTERYSRLPSGVTDDAYQSAVADQYKITDPNQAANDYRTNAIQRAQERITGINQEYGKRLESELGAQAPVNQNAEGRVDALSSLMGLAGSSSSVTRTNRAKQDSENINAGIRSKVNMEKMNALNAIYDRIDQGAEDAAKAALETNKANRAALLEAVKSNATSQVQALSNVLAENGKTFEDWKKSDNGASLQKLAQQSGMSEYQLQYLWNQSIPEELRPVTHTTYLDDGMGGTKMQQIFFNPITKKVETKEYALAVPSSVFNGTEKPIEGKNGELFVRQADGSYKDVSPNADYTRSLLNLDKQRSEAEISKLQSETFKNYQGTGSDLKVVKINGQDYVQNTDGTFTTPVVSGDSKQATDLQKSALSSAKDLLSKFIDPKTGKVSSTGGLALGKSGSFWGSEWLYSGTPVADFKVQFDNLKSLLSLENVKYLKGQGQVSDAERKLLADASAKLNLSQSESEFKQSLEDAISVLNKVQDAPSSGSTSEVDTQAYIDSAREELGREPTEEELKLIYPDVFNKPLSMGEKSSVLNKVLAKKDGTDGGWCGRFVNQLTGINVGDSYKSKLAKMDPSIKTPGPGMVGVMPVNGQFSPNGHIFITLSGEDRDGNVTVRDSNWKGDKKILTHKIPVSKITGFRKIS